MSATRKIGGTAILTPETLNAKNIGQAVEHLLHQAEHLADADPDDIDYSTLRIKTRPLDDFRVMDLVELEMKVEVK